MRLGPGPLRWLVRDSPLVMLSDWAREARWKRRASSLVVDGTTWTFLPLPRSPVSGGIEDDHDSGADAATWHPDQDDRGPSR
jgi:hypothetical protein